MKQAVLEGTSLTPVLALTFDPGEPFPRGVELPKYPAPVSSPWSKFHKPAMPKHPRGINEWVKALPGRRWDRQRGCWIVSRPGPHIQTVLEDLGFDIDLGPGEGHLRSLDDLYDPRVILDPADPAGCLVHLRFGDYATVERWLPAYSEWNAKGGYWWVSTADILSSDERLPLSRAVIDESNRQAQRPAFRFGSATEQDLAFLAQATDDETRPGAPIVWKPERPLFGYQASGARAVAGGHSLLTDEPGLGKTASSIAAHATVGTKRLVVVCPPVVLSNWSAELAMAGYSQEEPDAEKRTYVVRPGRKVRDFPDRGVVIVADSLIAARPQLVQRLLDWNPDGLIVDEAHREKSLTSNRSRAVRRLAHGVSGLRVPITGTPVVSSPQDLAPLLDISGHLEPVFNGLSAYMTTFCRKDKMRGWVPRMKALPMLREQLEAHVWVSRRLDDVIQLPDIVRSALLVDVNTSLFNEAHAGVVETVADWLDSLQASEDARTGFKGWRPASDEMRAAVHERSFELISRLRQAAGLAKIDAAKAWVQDYLESHPKNKDGLYDDPLIVWTHHREVTEAMIAAVSSLDATVAAIWGNTSSTATPTIVKAFQDGRIGALVGSITAAGVGVTLTRGHDALFVETDWTPAPLQQAENRQRRIGQKSRMRAVTLVAPGTLDERIQEILANTAQVLDPIRGEGNDMSVVVDMSETALRDTISSIIDLADRMRRER